MATSVIPKSEFRKNDNISFEYGEVPAIEVAGVVGWGLPGGHITFSEAEALAFAKQLNKEIRARMKDPKQLLTAKT